MPKIDGRDKGNKGKGKSAEPELVPTSELEYEPDEPLADLQSQSAETPEPRSARKAQRANGRPRPPLRDEAGKPSDGDDASAAAAAFAAAASAASAPPAATSAPSPVPAPAPADPPTSPLPPVDDEIEEPPEPSALSYARTMAVSAPAYGVHDIDVDDVRDIDEPAGRGAGGAYRTDGAYSTDETSIASVTGSIERHGRRSSKRRGLGLMVTGGCAGIAVVGFLVFGSGGGGAGSTSGGVVSTSGVKTTAAQVVSISDAPTTGASDGPSTSPTASATTTSASPSPSHTPTHTASSTPTTSPSSPGSTSPTTTTSATHTAKPSTSPTATKTTCWLFC
jgi:hypothetical protein